MNLSIKQWLAVGITAVITILTCTLYGCNRNGVLIQCKPVGVHRVVVKERIKDVQLPERELPPVVEDSAAGIPPAEACPTCGQLPPGGTKHELPELQLRDSEKGGDHK